MPNIFAKVNQLLPTRNADGGQVAVRLGSYGDVITAESMVAPDQQGYEGSHFVTLPSPSTGGTGTAMSIQTTFSDTTGTPLVLSNGDANKYAILEYIRIRCTAAGSATTSSEVAFEVDNTNRYSSGGSTQTVYNNAPTSGAPATIITARIGTITCAAAGAQRRWIGHHLIRKAAAPCWIVDDTLTFTFGNIGVWIPQNVAMPLATTAINVLIPFSPAVIPPSGSFVMHIANVANTTTAPSFEIEAGWFER